MSYAQDLERNVGYVVALVNEKPGELSHFQLTLDTMIRHDRTNPLGLKEARDAIEEAERRGLIEAKQKDRFHEFIRYYYPVSK